jgi:prepilin-type N-terminal cleavage/methylation domain-containing protein
MSSDRRPRPAPNGFTFVELVVAITIAGIFAAIVFQLMQGQSKLVAYQSSRQEVQQNARGAVELIGSDLRGVTPWSIGQADANSLRVWVPRAWGSWCFTNGARTEMHILVPTAAATQMGTNSTTGVQADISTTDVPVMSPAPSAAPRATVDSVRPATLAQTPQCAAMNPLGNVTPYILKGANFPTPTLPNAVSLYDVVTYDVQTSEGQSWVYRTTAGSAQPLAGPLTGATGLRFEYFAAGAAAPMAAPGATAATLETIRRIRVVVNTKSRSDAGGSYAYETDSLTVFVRNQQ